MIRLLDPVMDSTDGPDRGSDGKTRLDVRANLALTHSTDQEARMPILDPLIAELQEETEATRRVLERVPGDKLAWRPHPRSMTLGQLALHVASVPGTVAELAQLTELDATTVDFSDNPQPAAKDEILVALDEQLKAATDILASMSDEAAMETWTLKAGDQVALAIPRLALVRSLLLNHLYHHRGQLTVYLRVLDVPLPVVYGVTADENPFLEMVDAQAAPAG
jgi:uncharacterized damage-inducible protein DinB